MRPSLWNPQDQSPSTQRDHMRLFALQATEQLGKAISHRLGQPLASHEEREFEDGEHKARPIDDVSGKDAYVIQSLHGGPSMSANDKLCRLLFFIGCIEGCRRFACYGGGALLVLRAQRSPHQTQRSRH